MTPAESRHAHSYHENDVLYFSRGSKHQAIPKGAYLRVAEVNENSLTLEAENGRRIEFDPRTLKGVQAYTVEARTIAVGDRLQWREPDNKRRIANGEYATITKLDAHQVEVKSAKGRKVSMPLSDARKIDLGYASTSHASQGSTFDRAIVHIDTNHGAGLVNQRQLYVSISRARLDARIYTNDAEKMRRVVARMQEKELALDLAPKQQQRQPRSIGMRL
jgi:hypothetical protein